MDSLDGFLQVPPDRSQILGKQSWKTRYVAVGSSQSVRRDRLGSQALSRTTSGLVNSVISKSVNKSETDDVYLFVFKSKEDGEPAQRWLLSHVSDCQVQLLSHRKQGPVLPTLVVSITDNQRKRRSSRAAGFISSNKDSNVKTLWFRTPPDDHHPSLHDWARFIMAKKCSVSPTDNPASPVCSSLFQIPSYDRSEYSSRPGSGHRAHQHMSSIANHSTTPSDPSATFSAASPSLRSRRSDVSSPSSQNHSVQRVPYSIPEQHYTTILPGDIVTPGHHGEYQGQVIEGWTSVKGRSGRSSTMSSPIRGRDSVGSSQSQQLSPIVDVTSPPAPGETILDRAFQLGQIPGAESPLPGQENLSSIARFDALFRESDYRARRQHARRSKAGKLGPQTTLDENEDDEDYDEDDEEEDDDDGISPDNGKGGGDDESDAESDKQSLVRFQCDHNIAPLMSPSAQRALAFITSGGRSESDRSLRSHRPSVSRAHIADGNASPPLNSLPPSRPHTSHGKNRPNASRSQSTSHIPPTAMTGAVGAPLSVAGHGEAHLAATIADKRHSSSSDKRLSFTEFTKKLSSTSSLLLVQTNASAGSSHASSETDMPNSSSTSRTDLTLRGSGAHSRSKKRDDLEKRCRWQETVGVISAEGRVL
ncbi:hypothetical protein E4U42_004745 [Claviceps africana]|uniref:Uncharacterized protein n=1 Tax=Claviceps africana TaxID=83212 RepID=A0A8K0NHW0_9HYPO|nr:hypothetical protein E4U42_004745 [Claviceps africana]